MIRIASLVLVLQCVAIQLLAQDNTAALTNRIAELETENRKLTETVMMFAFSQMLRNGVQANVSIGDTKMAKLVIARDGWGDGRPEDIAAVCVSCAETVFQAIRPDKGNEPTVFLMRNEKGPMVVSQRGPNGEYFVLLSAGDRHWSQVAYQFSHELGHVLCGDLSLKMPQHWFEESFCESLSLWTMDKMGDSWKTNAPYDNWKSYAPNLTSYVKGVRDRVQVPDNLPDWYRIHRTLLTREAYDRDKNLILAKYLADVAHKNPDFYQAFLYFRHSTGEQVDSIEWLLADWSANCPPRCRFAPRAVAECLGVTPRK